jgi:hypothetical protein
MKGRRERQRTSRARDHLANERTLLLQDSSNPLFDIKIILIKIDPIDI